MRNTILCSLMLLFITFALAPFSNAGSIEYTFSMIKPDAVKRHLVKEINQNYFEKNGLIIVAQKKLTLSKAQAEDLYGEHKGRPFYNDLIKYITSGPVVVQVLRGKNAVKRNREIMGKTDPKKAGKATIRYKYAISKTENSVHGSESLEAAKREINIFFDYDKVKNDLRPTLYN